MAKRNFRPNKRIKNLILVMSLTAIILIVSTYAWFVGMRTVNVSDFDVEIAATDSLMLSLDGSSWSSTVSINKDTINSASYLNNTNHWGDQGLFPVSSIGAMDSTSSTMKLFEKASLTATPGGYRLMASRVKNYDGNPEQDGYVAFDLFVKNFSGTQYIKALDLLDEEAIYLTNDSSVTVAADGVANTGIENSVRVAFAQIGRVAGTTTETADITGIKCTPEVEDTVTTGICRTAQIWEPNDRFHVTNAISWYETSCLGRTALGTDITSADSYTGECGQVINGLAYPTYAVSADIASSDNVDVYDGPAYNGYEASTSLVPYPYFTDSDKLLTSTNRPTFMTLAPNSITKVRIYIYIEGQDVDNYDFASIGKKITVKFGFTKERFTEDDINYDGPDLNQGAGPAAADKTAPIITLEGENPTTLTVGTQYVDAGATATDNVDGELTLALVTSGTVNHEVPGTYKIVYSVTDAAGNLATKTRTIVVQ